MIICMKAFAESAAESNSAAHAAGWYEMNWKVRDNATKNKRRYLHDDACENEPDPVIKCTPRQRTILEAITKDATSSRGIGAMLGISSSIVAGHANLMERKGLIRIIVAGKPGSRKRFYYITDEGRLSLERASK